MSLLEGTSRVALALHFARCGTPLGVINSYLLFFLHERALFLVEKLSGVPCENTQKSIKTLYWGIGKTHKNQ